MTIEFIESVGFRDDFNYQYEPVYPTSSPQIHRLEVNQMMLNFDQLWLIKRIQEFQHPNFQI